MNIRIIKYLVISFIIQGFTISMKGQFYSVNNDLYSYSCPPQNLVMASPQSTSFMQYGHLELDKYNGLLDLEIDLGGYKDNDFDIPITLRYISNGFMPQRRPGIVGNNWMLNCGGVITRIVNGSPDDMYGYYTINKDEMNKYLLAGLLVATKSPGYPWRSKDYSDNNLLNLNVHTHGKKYLNPYDYGDLQYDMEPDIFHYSFGRYSGSFIIQNHTGNPILLNDNGCKVDLSQMALGNQIAPWVSQIKITTPEGYIYTFGKDTSYTEVIVPIQLSDNPDYKIMISHVKSWYLYSIEAPNKREVIFKYKCIPQLNSYYYSYLAEYNETGLFAMLGGVYPYSKTEEIGSNAHTIFDRIYLPVIEEIIVDETSIKFTTDRWYSFFYDPPTARDIELNSDKNTYLKSIDWYYNNEKIKSALFSYSTSGRYFFLSTLNNNSEIYTFTYNLNYELPNPGTIGSDWWGYWNGGYDRNESSEETFPKDPYSGRYVSKKGASEEFFDVTLLNKITYPTGGWTEIFYEPNKYNYSVQQGEMKQVNSGISICGGARVKKQKDFDPLSGKYYNIREYFYKESIEGNDYGLLNAYTFNYKTQRQTSGSGSTNGFALQYVATTTTYSCTNLPYSHMFGEHHVSYPCIIEKHEDNSYKKSVYTSWIDIPDKNDTKFKYHYSGSTSTIAAYSSSTGMYITNDLSFQRGKLLTEETYDSNYQLKRKTKNIYNYINGDVLKIKNVSVKSHPWGMASYILYDRSSNLLAQEITDENGITLKRRYDYNNKNFVTQIYDTISSNEVHKKEIVYSYDINFPNFVKEMKSKNILNTVLAESVSKIKPFYQGINSYTYAQNVQYNQYGKLSDGLYKPIKIFTSISEPISGYDINIKSYIQHNGDNSYPGLILEKEIKYDLKGNIQEITHKDGTKIVYLWSYNYQYPVAEIKNVSYNSVNTTLSSIGISIENLSESLNPDMNKVNSLRNHSNLKEAQITTYTYKPLVGITSQTDPRGITTYYGYDNANRLNEVYIIENGQKQILECYDYNYAN